MQWSKSCKTIIIEDSSLPSANSRGSNSEFRIFLTLSHTRGRVSWTNAGANYFLPRTIFHFPLSQKHRRVPPGHLAANFASFMPRWRYDNCLRYVRCCCSGWSWGRQGCDRGTKRRQSLLTTPLATNHRRRKRVTRRQLKWRVCAGVSFYFHPRIIYKEGAFRQVQPLKLGSSGNIHVYANARIDGATCGLVPVSPRFVRLRMASLLSCCWCWCDATRTGVLLIGWNNNWVICIRTERVTGLGAPTCPYFSPSS